MADEIRSRPPLDAVLAIWGRRKWLAILVFVGFNLTFFPQFVLGYLGMPRRYHVYPPEFQVLNVMSTAGASILAVGYALPLFYLIWSLRFGHKAGVNPWGAVGLEWTDFEIRGVKKLSDDEVVLIVRHRDKDGDLQKLRWWLTRRTCWRRSSASKRLASTCARVCSSANHAR